MHPIVDGKLKVTLLIGQNLKRLDLRIKMLENTEIYILVHLILRALKKYYENKLSPSEEQLE